MLMNVRQLLFPIVVFLLFSCESDPLVGKAKKDAEFFLKNVRTPERLINHPMMEPEGIPSSVAFQNKKRNLENLKGSVNQLCGKSSNYKLANTFKKIGEDGEKFIYLEYEYCQEITFVLGYALRRDGVILHSIWPMNKEDRPEDMFQKEANWN
jgi:hypothetical protein